jgi:muramoyltetrapeptide carboxypeptidase
VARLKSLGHEVEVDEAALASFQRFAGNDATRLAGIHRAAASGADVAMISRGGYGLTRLLSGIQYRAIEKSIHKGTKFVGMSDFTAFQLAVLAKSGTQTWTGPSLCEGFGTTDPGPDEIMEACFDDLVHLRGEGTGWSMRQENVKPSFTIRNAELWGGNLSVLVSLIGTPYFPNIKGGILFLEDVAEHPYRIERMLTQLLHSGVLAKQRALLLGHFTDFKSVQHDKGFKLASVIDWLRSKSKIPILTRLPFGHVPTKVALPVGAKVDLHVEGKDVLLLWGHQD